MPTTLTRMITGIILTALVTRASSNTGVATTGAAGAVTSLSIGSTIFTATSATDPSKSDSITLTVNPAGTLAWTRQFGTSSSDEALGIAAAADGHVYTTGYTTGALEGSYLGSLDAFIRKYGP